MALTLPPLPYDFAALEPTIDAKTMQLHHDKHHQAYIDAFNKAAEADPKLQGDDLEAILSSASNLPPVARNNGGGHWNHSFFWQIMSPPSDAGEPSEALRAAIQSAFGSLDEMKTKFRAAGTGRFGSGWVWLIVAGGELAITSTPNQDNPLMDVAEQRGRPILGNDVWEHAYYLTYNNRRADYLDAWWNVVNWAEVSRRYEAEKRA